MENWNYIMRVDVETLVRKSIKKAARYKFDKHHESQARTIFKALEKKHGKTDPVNLRLADTYAQEVLGNARYAPWLRVYTAFTGTFKEGWIPDNYYGTVVVPRMKGLYGDISSLKSLSNIIFSSDTFPDIAYFVNGLFFTANHIAVPESEVEDLVFANSEKIVFKLDSSFQGKGILFFNRQTFNVDTIKSLGNGVIQRFIVQHPLFNDFASNAVATLRVTSVVDDAGLISIRACFLRLGRVADTHIQPDSEICVPVDISSGKLYAQGYLPDWMALDEHPDSKIKFDGISVPAFPECVGVVLELHKKIPFARCVGWDLTVDKNGSVQVLEWNAEHNDVKFGEATQGPCFTDLKWERLRPLSKT